jgi:hypothetical protein
MPHHVLQVRQHAPPSMNRRGDWVIAGRTRDAARVKLN